MLFGKYVSSEKNIFKIDKFSEPIVAIANTFHCGAASSIDENPYSIGDGFGLSSDEAG
ncbi:MAG: hypothetical protein ACI8Z5_002447 [Lentimonas sp.]